MTTTARVHFAETASLSDGSSAATLRTSTPFSTPEVMLAQEDLRVGMLAHGRPSHWMQDLDKRGRRSKWKELTEESHDEPGDCQPSIEERWAAETRALGVEFGIPLGRRNAKRAIRAIKREIDKGNVPSASELRTGECQHKHYLGESKFLDIEQGLVDFLHLITTTPFDYAYYLSSVPLIAGPGRRHYDEIKRMKGTSTVDSRIWLWHQHEFESRGITREALILEGGKASTPHGQCTFRSLSR